VAPEEDFIGGMDIQSTTAKHVVLRITRDGVVLGEKTYDVVYAVKPPDECTPNECRSARLTFP
jgi:hypothetical protein